MSYTVISHDAFARYELIRQTVETSSSCTWCGNRRNGGKLFQYGTLDDGVYTYPNWQRAYFCSISCMRMYHE